MPIIDPLSYGQNQWHIILSDYDQSMRSRMRDLVFAHSSELTDSFYQQMMALPEAREFLEHQVVNQRLKASMILWLKQAFSIQDTSEIAAAVEHQLEVGKVHARINLPINLVSLGARLHKRRLLELISNLWQTPADWLPAVQYLQDVMDVSLELMSLAYVTKSDRKSRADEAYRLHSLSLNLSVERERQRAALLDWSHELMFALHSGEATFKGLSRSEFGLWFYHQAISVFDGAPEINQIEQVLQHIDLVLLPQLQASAQSGNMVEKMAQLQQEVKAIIYFLTTLFDRYIELEQGRDTLTRLLDRRFLPAVMNREVKLSKRNSGVFSVILFDIDHFKAINDNHGHEGGDMVLQQVANLVAGAVRSSDFVFRYGGEELLLVLVEVSADKALVIADKIRTKLMNNPLKLPGNQTQQVTMSGGVATFDGHPDYEHLINRADKALYRAKSLGRNLCAVAE
ncbi:GGDEF domain-containing protein [Oceanisphaera pacifica]|uniref:Diguanylate cyclase DosC n=1 Tax=Oceanisphaera pacifica TaxID=2818389 RepID=A0ABS3NEV1_9GAMM|nr:GGDEF domain-containing protein [Oceanisphaera pacifica]MBO1518913.1 GGDEF domain-containing protein [Oceanisphaera pacifica]